MDAFVSHTSNATEVEPINHERKPKPQTETMKLMTTTALVIALISLGLASVAYWRSGGKQDVPYLQTSLQRDLEALRTRQKEIVDSASQSLVAAYDRSRQPLAAAPG